MYSLIFIATQTVLGTFATLPMCEKGMRDHAIRAITGPAFPSTPEIEKAVELQLKYNNTYMCLKVDKKPTKK